MVDGALHMPMKRVEQKLAVFARRSALARQEDDIAHRFYRPQVVGMHRDRQSEQKVVHRKTVTAFAAHGCDVNNQAGRIMLNSQGGLFDELATGRRVDRAGEVDDM